ncbi:3'(2'),5'-bisphosphate nucleotidase CysQ [Pseudokineococcus basanitobsidens]|uniref:3'(2'),5-bisphosphonucleoside 3'(2')-phosphohydrolase n=1 Tax=Pseudokineococcus basanitobsidens TaxID=1926649 RepID=A0ABU8RML5_9ACTN
MPTTRTDDELARQAADEAGRALLAVRADLAAAGADARSIKDAGDRRAQEVLASLLAAERPDDAVLSEEAADDPGRLSAARVWIVDPLDGTREFSEVGGPGEDGRTDWAVHVALWQEGELVAGAVALPAAGTTYGTDEPPVRPTGAPQVIRLAVSRSRPPAFVTALAAELGAELVPMGSAGVKATSVLRDEADAYVHAGGQYEWDSAAPVVVARAAGLHTSRVDGSPLVYNRPDPTLPDLVVARPEVAGAVLDAIARVAAREGREQPPTTTPDAPAEATR